MDIYHALVDSLRPCLVDIEDTPDYRVRFQQLKFLVNCFHRKSNYANRLTNHFQQKMTHNGCMYFLTGFGITFQKI